MHDYRDGAAIRGWHAHVYFEPPPWSRPARCAAPPPSASP